MKVNFLKVLIISLIVVFLTQSDCKNVNAETIKKYDMEQYNEDVYSRYKSAYNDVWKGELSENEKITYCIYLKDTEKFAWAIEAGSKILDCDLSVSKYLEILTNLLSIMDLDLQDYINQQSSIDALKSITDYAGEVADIATATGSLDDLPLNEISNKVKSQMEEISDALEINIGSLTFTIDSIERMQLYEKTIQEFDYYNSFLNAIEQHANESELKQAAGILKKNMNDLLSLKIIQISDTANDAAELLGKDIFLDKMVPELLEMEKDLSGSKLSESDIECLQLLHKSYSKLSSYGELTFKLVMFGGDMLFGTTNMYIRYNEILAMKNIRDALNKEIVSLDEDLTSENQNEQIQKIVELMSSVVYVDCRGTYSVYSLLENDGQLLSLVNFNNYDDYEEWYETEQQNAQNRLNSFKTVFPSLDNYLVEENVVTDIIEYYGDWPLLVNDLQMQHTERWQFSDSESYEKDGFYLEWENDLFSMKNERSQYIQIHGISLYDNISQADQKLLEAGWTECGNYNNDYHYIKIEDGQRLVLTFTVDSDDKITFWYFNNWPEDEYILGAFAKLEGSSNIIDLSEDNPYRSIIEEYQTALERGKYYVEQNLDEFPHINHMIVGYYFSGMTSLYYTFLDVDGNGVEELLLGDGSEGMVSNVWDLYGTDGENAYKLFWDDALGNRSRLEIYTDGTIYKYNSGGITGSSSFYHMSENGYSIVETENYRYDQNGWYDANGSFLTGEDYERKFENLTKVDFSQLIWTELLMEGESNIIEQDGKYSNPQITEQKQYLEELEIVAASQYTGNLGDSFIYKLGEHKDTRGNTDINGQSYSHGIEAWIARWNNIAEISWASSTFQLDGVYSTVTGSCVLIDSYNTDNFDSTLEVYADEALVYTYHLSPNSIPFEIEWDVKGADQLRIYVYDNIAVPGGTSFGLVDMKLE